MTEPFTTPAPAEEPESEPAAPARAVPADVESALKTLIPRDPSERKRAFSSLLRAVLEERPTRVEES